MPDTDDIEVSGLHDSDSTQDETRDWIKQYTSQLESEAVDELAEEPVETEIPDSTVGEANVEDVVDEPADAPVEKQPTPTELELKKLTDAEEASRRALAELREEQKKWAEMKSSFLDKNQIKNMDPLEFIKMGGHDQEFITKLLVAERMKAAGKPVPTAVEKELSDYYNKREVRELKASLEAKERAAQEAAYFNRVSEEARSYVGQIDEKVAPDVFMLKEIPDFMHNEVLGELHRDATEKLARGEHNADLMSYEEAVKAVNKRYQPIVAAITAHVKKTLEAEQKKQTDKKGTLPKANRTVAPITKNDTSSGWGDPEEDIRKALRAGARAAKTGAR